MWLVYLSTKLQLWFWSPLIWTILWRNTAWTVTYPAGLWQDSQSTEWFYCKMADISWDKRQIINVHVVCKFWTHSSRIFLTSDCLYLKIIQLVHSAYTHAQKWTAKPYTISQFNILPTGRHEWDLLSQLLKAFLWLVSWKSHLFLLSWGCQTKTFW